MRRPTKSIVDTLRLGRRTSAINATHKPIPKAGKHIHKYQWGFSPYYCCSEIFVGVDVLVHFTVPFGNEMPVKASYDEAVLPMVKIIRAISMCPSPMLSQSHCDPVTLYPSYIVSWSQCVPVLCSPSHTVSQSQCPSPSVPVPCFPSPIVSQSHVSKSYCVQIPLCTSPTPMLSQPHCIPVPCCPSPTVSQSHVVPVALYTNVVPVPLHPSHILSQLHCILVPMCTSPMLSWSHCVPVPQCPSPMFSQSHVSSLLHPP